MSAFWRKLSDLLERVLDGAMLGALAGVGVLVLLGALTAVRISFTNEPWPTAPGLGRAVIGSATAGGALVALVRGLRLWNVPR